MTRVKTSIKLLIMLGLALLTICIFNTTANATTNEEIQNLIPDTISVDIPEIEYDKAQTLIENKVKEIIANSNIEDKNTLNVSANYNVLYFYKANVKVGSVQKEVNVSFNNTNNANAEDEQYVKNLKIEKPKYIETDLNYMAVNNDPWQYCENKLFDYFAKKVNHDNVKCVAKIGQGAGNGINLETINTYLYIFKNNKLYDIRDIKGVNFIPVVNVPANITDNELNKYVVDEVNKIYDYNEYGYASITKKENDIYTLNSENEYKDYYTCEIMIKREKATTVTSTDTTTKIKLDTTSAVVPENTKLVAEEVKSGDKYNVVVKAIENDVEKFVLYDISLVNNNATIQPNGKVKVSIPVPAGYDTSKIVVYRVAEDGTKTEYKTTIKDGFITFETDHFSNYVVAEEKSKETTTTNKETSTTTYATTNTTNANTSERKLDTTPKTGLEENSNIIISTILSLVSIMGIVVVKNF